VADPGECSLDDPAFGKHDEAMQFIALDDRQLPGAGLGDGGRGLLPPVPGISEDKLDEGEEAACAPMIPLSTSFHGCDCRIDNNSAPWCGFRHTSSNEL
jgi:hypothetical protein